MNVQHRTARRLAVAGLLPSVIALAGWAPASRPALNITNLVNRAVHDTNTVNTLIYTVDDHQSVGQNSLHIVLSGQEDEVANAERDHAKATVRQKASTGQIVTTTYTDDVVLIKNHTYYRDSKVGTVWHVKPGMSFTGPFAAVSFQRGRTKVPTFNGIKFTLVGSASGVLVHLKAQATRKGAHYTLDVYISNGSTPYVVRHDELTVQTSNGQTFRETTHYTFGPFNTKLNITAPSSSA